MAIVGLFLLSVLSLWALVDLRTPPRPAATGHAAFVETDRQEADTYGSGAHSGWLLYGSKRRSCPSGTRGPASQPPAVR